MSTGRARSRARRKGGPAFSLSASSSDCKAQGLQGAQNGSAPAGGLLQARGKGWAGNAGLWSYFTSLKPAESTRDPSLPLSAGTQQTLGALLPEKQTWQAGRPSGMVILRR